MTDVGVSHFPCKVRGCDRPATYYPVIELTASNGGVLRSVVGAPTCGLCKSGVHSLDRVLGEGGGRRYFMHMQRTFQAWFRTEAVVDQRPVQLVGRRLAWCRTDSPEALEFCKMREGRDEVPVDSVAIGDPREVRHD